MFFSCRTECSSKSLPSREENLRFVACNVQPVRDEARFSSNEPQTPVPVSAYSAAQRRQIQEGILIWTIFPIFPVSWIENEDNKYCVLTSTNLCRFLELRFQTHRLLNLHAMFTASCRKFQIFCLIQLRLQSKMEEAFVVIFHHSACLRIT